MKASKLKKKKITFKIKAKAKGKLTYKVLKGAKYIKVSKSGKVTVKKKTKKGAYRILITAAQTGGYRKATKVIKVKIK